MKQIVLMYHDVYRCDVKESGFQAVGAIPYKVSLTNFENQVRSISQYCEDKKIDKSMIVFTFDDGGASFATVIPDVLERYGFKGIFFISTLYLGTEGFMTVNEVRELALRGHEIGAHSHTHPGYSEATKMSQNQLSFEWQTSVDVLNKILGYSIRSVSLPNGYSSEYVLNILEDMDISKIYTSTPTTRIVLRKRSLLIGRYDVQDNMSLSHVMSIVNSPIMRIKYQLKSDVLSVAKKMLGGSYSVIKRTLLSKK